MASLWQRTLFYLGLVDDEQMEAAEEASVRQNATPSVRTVRSRTATRPQTVRTTQPQQQQPAPAQPPSVTRGVAGRRLEPPEASRRRVSSNPRLAEAGVYVHEGGSAPVRSASASSETIIIEARTFSDAQSLADHIRGENAVVLDLRSTEPSMVRRLVDFSTGLTYALDGRMAKIGRGVILVTPQGVSVGADEQQRLAGLGLYETQKS